MLHVYQAYQKQNQADMPRIDLLLSLYDGAIARLEEALEFLRKNDGAAAAQLVTKTQLIVAGLASGLDLSYGEVPQNLLRLYEFILHGLGEGGIRNLTAALEVLRSLREGLEHIQPEARQMERSGAIPPLTYKPNVTATA